MIISNMINIILWRLIRVVKPNNYKAQITFLEEAKKGKYAPIEKSSLQYTRFEDNSAKIEELYHYTLD